MQILTKLLAQIGIILFFSTSCVASVSGQFVVSENIQKAYRSMMSMRINEAKTFLNQERATHPNNLLVEYIANYEQCLKLLINGDERLFHQWRDLQDERLRKIDMGDARSPWYLYTKAAIHFHWATIKVRFGENISAANDFRKSFALLKENIKKFPSFPYNNILYGVEEAMVGTIPDSYKWISSILGMKGNLKNGIHRVNHFLASNHEFLREEAVFFYSFLRFSLLADKQGAIQFLKKQNYNYREHRLMALLMANFLLFDNKSQEVINILSTITESSTYESMPLINYQLGLAYFLKNDRNCMGHFNQFIQYYKGKIFIKDAYQRLSLFYYLHGDVAKSWQTKSHILRNGSLLVDSDKQAQRFAQQKDMPHKQLLLARMYCDGGYFKEGMQVVQQISLKELDSYADKLEYYYRVAKLSGFLGQNTTAVENYEKAIAMIVPGTKEHFGARSALELGELYEQEKYFAKALQYYRMCLSLKGHDYKTSIDQRAKSGIQRLSH